MCKTEQRLHARLSRILAILGVSRDFASSRMVSITRAFEYLPDMQQSVALARVQQCGPAAVLLPVCGLLSQLLRGLRTVSRRWLPARQAGPTQTLPAVVGGLTALFI
jgi:hypothetical protein